MIWICSVKPLVQQTLQAARVVQRAIHASRTAQQDVTVQRFHHTHDTPKIDKDYGSKVTMIFV